MLLIAQQEPAQTTLATIWSDNWVVIIFVLLGFATIFSLLPNPKRIPGIIGAFLGAITLFFGGFTLVHAEVALPETILFYSFSGIAILSGGIMITQTQPVRAALSFALVVLSTCGLFLLQAAPFLMAATIIIYAGAIVVTFLFVIMLAQQTGLDNADYRSREPFLATLAGFVLLGAILCVVHRSFEIAPNHESAASIEKAMQKVSLALDKESFTDLQSVLGDNAEVLKELEEKVSKDLKVDPKKPLQNEFVRQLRQPLEELEIRWIQKDTEEIKSELAKLFQIGMRLRNEVNGVLQAPDYDPLGREIAYSPFSGTPANEAPRFGSDGKVHMPAENVRAIGRSLFTDYLLPIEMVATLLLVATIGAIAIAGRKSEGVR